MFTRGIKRKCLDPEEIDGSLVDLKTVPSYTLERQSLLDMSLVKLQLCHMLVEPNLCRSVLIANTVRQIQEEMTQDGSWPVFHKLEQAPLERLVSTDVLCRSSKEQDESKHIDESYITYSEELEVQETQEIAELSPVPPVKVLQNSPGFWEVESPQENKAHLQKSLDHIFESLENRNASAMEDLFSEVDTSYYDLDTVLTGMMGNSKLGHCEMLDSLSSQAAPHSHCKAEMNEIDHIVEILVES
ncbi:PREDICTED: cell division cycle-associated protein 4-like [Nanorana parkeri]|uniref:cell division cycle-associated protein 4-like n=1 Tax=Nanorana parkeri TaxID=125878 RepID=UPI0008545104|nr:PREDICTED: cell division cycle-associated protein 4-like [Nanorana parkeri]XP_018411814.1 PREDICTED: cell division cycle-associated protein 4-like [Nanorana parkeri]XP_018411822.1 PREDICTED: cell division cycle-associated protein 4-like [Nanorana parkeri]